MQLAAPAANIYEALVACQADGTPAALAIIVAAVGSTPQKTGAKMLVKADGSTVGTVGGGEVEAEVIQAALEVLQIRDAPAPGPGIDRGGGLSLRRPPARFISNPWCQPPPLIIVGAGHVGLALAALAAFVGYRVTLVDDREMPLPPGLAQANLVKIEDYATALLTA